MQTGPESVRVDGLFTIRGATKPEELKLTRSRDGTARSRDKRVSQERVWNGWDPVDPIANCVFQGFSTHA